MNFITAALALSLIGVEPGTAVFPLLKIGQGPRASAMGESFTGLSDDASAVYWNPAGLGRVRGYHFALSHQQWFEDIKDEIGHAALPLGPGAFGIGLVYSGEPDVRYWDEGLQKFQTFDAWSGILTAGYGLRLSERYRLGASVTGLCQDLNFETGYGGAADIGFSGNPAGGLGIGLVARHLGMMTFGDGNERLPTEFAAGLAYEAGMFKLTADAVYPLYDNDVNFRGGLEFAPVSQFALRVGYRNGPVHLSSLGYENGLCGGVGVTVGNFGLDYAYVPYGDLGATHRVGLRTVIPPPVHGAHSFIALDAETRERLAANMAVSGVYDTTATAYELALRQLLPGDGTVRATLDEYEPQTRTFTVVAGRRKQDTLLLKKLTADIAGGIYDAKTQKPIGGTIAYSGPASGKLPVPAAPGTFMMKGVKAGRYVLDASGPTDEYLAQTAPVEVPPGQSAKRDFFLWRRGDFLVLEGVNFETGKADILPQFHPILDRAGEILTQTPVIKKVELAGHTDPRVIKTAEFPSNWELSQARAAAVRDYLIRKFGIAPERLVAKGYADTQPVASNATPEGMYKNRRTELRILE